MGNRGTGVRAIAGRSIQLDFVFRGIRCRETLPLEPTRANMRHALGKRAAIEREIALGTFKYEVHFPNSKRARKLAATPGDAMTVAQLFKEWLPTIRDHVEWETYKMREQAVNSQLGREFGALKLTEMSRQAVRTWIGTLGAMSDKRLANLLTPLRQSFAWAVEEGHIANDPLAGLKVRRRIKAVPQPDAAAEESGAAGSVVHIDPYAPDEFAAVLRAVPTAVDVRKGKGNPTAGEQLHNLFQFWVWTGVRFGELIALTWRDVNVEAGTAMVDKARRGRRVKAPKTKSSVRQIRLLPPAIEALKRQQARTRLAGKEVFPNPNTGQPWVGSSKVRKFWEKASKSARVKWRYPYQLRHTFASWMLSAGENPLWVARQLGHADWSMIARVYGKFVPALDQQAGMRGVNAVLGQP